MLFRLWIKQSGDGCDYTIGCGSALWNIEAKDKKDAREKAIRILKHYNRNDETQIEKAYLMSDVEDLSEESEKILDDIEDENKKAEIKEKRKKLNQLKKELGEDFDEEDEDDDEDDDEIYDDEDLEPED